VFVCSVADAAASDQRPPVQPSAARSGDQRPAPPAGAPQRLRVFLDCNECDETFLRQNVEFIDYVREPAVADLHVLVTTEGTGGGGRAWTLKFIGLGRRQGHDHTVTFTTPTTATGDERRHEFARYFSLGLVAYAAETPVAPQLSVTWRRPAEESAATETRDPWNFWVFRVSASGDVSGESLSRSRSYRASFSSSRTTEQWKIDIHGNTSVNTNRFEIDETETIDSRSESWSAGTTFVKSVGGQWAVGARTSVSHSTFSNTDRSTSFSPGIEYNFFPYGEWSRRSLTVFYAAGGTNFAYQELTIFDRLQETVPNHSVSVNLQMRQPWGSLHVSSNLSQHLNRMERYRASIFGSADVRIVQGLSFSVFGEYSQINDQISLPKGGASEEEVLLRVRQLATSYSYYVSFGLSYSFGSIFNNVVNPRFGG
jgi:hypothetical protein